MHLILSMDVTVDRCSSDVDLMFEPDLIGDATSGSSLGPDMTFSAALALQSAHLQCELQFIIAQDPCWRQVLLTSSYASWCWSASTQVSTMLLMWLKI